MLVTDPTRRALLGRAARADVIARFSPAVQGGELAAILADVVARCGAGERSSRSVDDRDADAFDAGHDLADYLLTRR